jgi:hypothetical protein
MDSGRIIRFFDFRWDANFVPDFFTHMDGEMIANAELERRRVIQRVDLRMQIVKPFVFIFVRHYRRKAPSVRIRTELQSYFVPLSTPSFRGRGQ